jgi:hypothetical protein
MAMNLRLTESETAALRRKAAAEGRSMQEVARAAIAEYVPIARVGCGPPSSGAHRGRRTA